MSKLNYLSKYNNLCNAFLNEVGYTPTIKLMIASLEESVEILDEKLQNLEKDIAKAIIRLHKFSLAENYKSVKVYREDVQKQLTALNAVLEGFERLHL